MLNNLIVLVLSQNSSLTVYALEFSAQINETEKLAKELVNKCSNLPVSNNSKQLSILGPECHAYKLRSRDLLVTTTGK